MAEAAELTPELRIGTRALETLDGFEMTGDLSWSTKAKRWTLPCRLFAEVPGDSRLPQMTSWWIHIPSIYPAGEIDFLPAKEGGIACTFPHQRYNGEGDSENPWRTGKLCLRTDIGALRRFGDVVEPQDPAIRLAWNVRRARHWLECAARGDLMKVGDHFELPDFPSNPQRKLAFCETRESLVPWQESDARIGFVQMLSPKGQPDLLVVTRFDVLPEIPWGSYLGCQAGDDTIVGVWVRAPQPVFVEPWQAPMTWSEVVLQLKDQKVDLSTTLPPILEQRLRSSGKEKPARPRHPLLIGFPIPEVVGKPAARMHWVGFELPPLAEGRETANGFRPDATGHYQKDLASLRTMRPLPWLTSQNWSDEDLTGRGKLPAKLREAKVLLIGAGALGSAVAEMLVRGGVRSIIIFDGDVLEAGNLVRHTLDLKDLGRQKAEALAERLNRISPHAQMMAINDRFPEIPDEIADAMGQVDVVLDCSADDDVLFAMERHPRETERLFVSLSLGVGAHRLYSYVTVADSFPRSAYVTAVAPWIEKDWKGVDEASLPREAAGCWNPLMPASAVDVWPLLGAAVKHLGNLVEHGREACRNGALTVFEQIEEANEFGVRQVKVPV